MCVSFSFFFFLVFMFLFLFLADFQQIQFKSIFFDWWLFNFNLLLFLFLLIFFLFFFFFLNNLWLWSYIYKHKRTQLHTLEFTVCTQTKVNGFWLANFREKKLHKIPFLRFRNRCKHLDDIGSGEKLNFSSINLFFLQFNEEFSIHTFKKNWKKLKIPTAANANG